MLALQGTLPHLRYPTADGAQRIEGKRGCEYVSAIRRVHPTLAACLRCAKVQLGLRSRTSIYRCACSLKGAPTGMPAASSCRKYTFSACTVHGWAGKGHLGVSMPSLDVASYKMDEEAHTPMQHDTEAFQHVASLISSAMTGQVMMFKWNFTQKKHRSLRTCASLATETSFPHPLPNSTHF